MKNILCPFCHKVLAHKYLQYYCFNCEDDFVSKISFHTDGNDEIIYLYVILDYEQNSYKLTIHYDLKITILDKIIQHNSKYIKIALIDQSFVIDTNNILSDVHKIIKKLIILQTLS